MCSASLPQNPARKAPNRLIIKGITENGEVFRPSDWAERACGPLSSFDNRRICYSEWLYPAIIDGQKCVILDKILQETYPELYQYLLDFAQANDLPICPE